VTDTKTLEIGEFTYVIKHARASHALRAAAILANGFAPLLNGFRRGRGDEMDKILLGLAETFANPDLAEHTEKLCEIFKPNTQVLHADGRSWSLGGDKGIFEQHFAGRIDALIKWLVAAVEFDLGGFLAEAKARFQAHAAAANAASSSQSPEAAAKTGLSGDS
jgi:hypothetical protein